MEIIMLMYVIQKVTKFVLDIIPNKGKNCYLSSF
jgi:hypothetical protein